MGMTQEEMIELIKTEKEIIALNGPAYGLFLSLALAYPVAKITKGFD